MKKIIQLALLVSLAITQAYAGNLDVKGSELNWKAYKGAMGFKLGGHQGKISFKDGNITDKDGKLTGGNFVVDMNSFTVEDLSGTWKKKFMKHMRSADFFQTDKYPTSNLKIKSVKGNKVIADLTINGITNEVHFDYKKSGDKFSGKFVFDRTKFGMNYGKDSSLGDRFIHHDVKLEFAVKAK